MSYRLILVLTLIGGVVEPVARTSAGASGPVSSDMATAPSLNGTYATVFRIAGVEYSGHAEFKTEGDGLAVGRLTLRSPAALSGDMTVRTAGTAVQFEMSYVREIDSCKGEGSGSGRIVDDGREITGDVEVSDCRSHRRTGSFSWSRQ